MTIESKTILLKLCFCVFFFRLFIIGCFCYPKIQSQTVTRVKSIACSNGYLIFVLSVLWTGSRVTFDKLLNTHTHLPAYQQVLQSNDSAKFILAYVLVGRPQNLKGVSQICCCCTSANWSPAHHFLLRLCSFHVPELVLSNCLIFICTNKLWILSDVREFVVNSGSYVINKSLFEDNVNIFFNKKIYRKQTVIVVFFGLVTFADKIKFWHYLIKLCTANYKNLLLKPTVFPYWAEIVLCDIIRSLAVG